MSIESFQTKKSTGKKKVKKQITKEPVTKVITHTQH